MILSALLLIWGMVCPVNALAAETLTLSLPCLEAKAGDWLEIPVTVSHNPGVISLKVEVSYDASVLTLEKTQAGDFKGVSFSPLTNNPVTVNWMNALQGNNTTNGILAVLAFRVKETAKVGEAALTLTANPDDIFNNDITPTPFALVNGGVTVLGEDLSPEPPLPDTPTDTTTPTDPHLPKLGDVNADGEIDAKDALQVLKISVGKLQPTPLQKQLADANKDTAINAKDALEILKYAVGKPSCLAK